MLLVGIIAGLAAYLAIPPAPGPDAGPGAASMATADPYEESRRSRAILEAQESAPPPVRFASTPPSRRGSLPTVGHPSQVRIVDGDTFRLAGAKIRIADIDTPEVRGRCPSEIALAARATRRMSQLLAQGPFELHSLPSGRDRDQYGRLLRIVTRGGRSLGDVLVAEGLARTWTGRREGWCG